MNVTFHYTAHLKAASGTASQTLSVADGASLRECFETLCKIASADLRSSIIDTQQQLRPAILLCVDDEQKSLDDPTPLIPNAQITLLAAISGG